MPAFLGKLLVALVNRNIYLIVFQNRVLRRIFGSKKERVTGYRGILYNEDLHDLFSSPNTIQAIKSRGMRWFGRVSRMGKKRKAYRVLVGKPEAKSHVKDLGTDGRIMLRYS